MEKNENAHVVGMRSSKTYRKNNNDEGIQTYDELMRHDAEMTTICCQLKDENAWLRRTNSSLERDNSTLVDDNKKLSKDMQTYIDKWSQALTLSIHFRNECYTIKLENEKLTKELEETKRKLSEVEIKLQKQKEQSSCL